MLYYEQSGERDVGARLMQILSGHNPWKLPERVDAEDRKLKQLASQGGAAALFRRCGRYWQGATWGAQSTS